MVLPGLSPALHFLGLSLWLQSLGLTLAGASLPVAAGSDPFAPGLRWAYASSQGEPWIPRSVAFVAGGEYLWAAPAVGTPHLTLFHTGVQEDPSQPLWSDDRLAGALGEVRVRAGDSLEELYALAQYPDPDGAHRRSVVTRHDALLAAQSGSFDPRWSVTLPSRGPGPAHLGLSADGEVVCVAVHDASVVRLDWLDPASGTTLRSEPFTADGLSAFALSADGGHVALALTDRLLVVPTDPLQATTELDVAGATTVSLSADAARIAHGAFGQVGVHARSMGSWTELTTLDGVRDEVVTRLALSEDGTTLALAWWNLRTAATVRCEVRTAQEGFLESSYVQSSAPGGPQNYPIAIASTADGSRSLFGTWGVGGTEPEVVLLERGASSAIQTFDLPGSVMAVALDGGGTRLAVAHKNEHANQFATQGALALFDTGERELQILGPQRPFGTLEVVQRASPGARVVFAVGSPADAPRSVPFASGQLFLDLTRPFVTRSATADPVGRAVLSLPIGDGQDLLGYPLALQSASIEGGTVRLSPLAPRASIF